MINIWVWIRSSYIDLLQTQRLKFGHVCHYRHGEAMITPYHFGRPWCPCPASVVFQDSGPCWDGAVERSMGGGVEDQDSWHRGMHHHQPAWYSAPWISDRSNSGSLGARLQWNDIGRRAVFFSDHWGNWLMWTIVGVWYSACRITHIEICSINGGTPKNGWSIVDDLIKMDDLGTPF